MPMVFPTSVRPFHTSSDPASTQPVRCSGDRNSYSCGYGKFKRSTPYTMLLKASVLVTLAGFAAYALALLSCGAYHILPDVDIADIHVSLRTPHVKLLPRNVLSNEVSSNHQSQLSTLAGSPGSITPGTSANIGSSIRLGRLDALPALTGPQITSASRGSDVRQVVETRDDTNGAPHPLNKRLTDVTRESMNRLLLSSSSLATCSPLHA